MIQLKKAAELWYCITQMQWAALLRQRKEKDKAKVAASVLVVLLPKLVISANIAWTNQGTGERILYDKNALKRDVQHKLRQHCINSLFCIVCDVQGVSKKLSFTELPLLVFVWNDDCEFAHWSPSCYKQPVWILLFCRFLLTLWWGNSVKLSFSYTPCNINQQSIGVLQVKVDVERFFFKWIRKTPYETHTLRQSKRQAT